MGLVHCTQQVCCMLLATFNTECKDVRCAPCRVTTVPSSEVNVLEQNICLLVWENVRKAAHCEKLVWSS